MIPLKSCKTYICARKGNGEKVWGVFSPSGFRALLKTQLHSTNVSALITRWIHFPINMPFRGMHHYLCRLQLRNKTWMKMRWPKYPLHKEKWMVLGGESPKIRTALLVLLPAMSWGRLIPARVWQWPEGQIYVPSLQRPFLSTWIHKYIIFITFGLRFTFNNLWRPRERERESRIYDNTHMRALHF